MNLKHLALLSLLSVAAVALPQAAYVRENYTKQEVEISMRDGVKLFTCIYAPKNATKKAPFLMMRTPYSCRPYGSDTFRDNLGPEAEFTKEGYIFVYQDVRGRYMSGGEFKWMTPYIPNKKPGEVDESTDTWDTIDWLLKNVANNNGKVGVYGTSFPGHYAAQTLIDPHPALAAVSPQAPMADNWLGDDIHHNGAFYLPHGMGFIAGFGKKREGPTQNYGSRVFDMGTPDGYRFYLDMGPVKDSLTKYNMSQIDIWKQWLAHPDYDEYWQAQNVPQHLKKAGNVPVLLVGGWWDAEDLQGPLAIYRAIEKFTPQNKTTLVMGPWYHGSWNGGPGNALHDITWQTKAGEDFRNTVQRPFFRYNLWGDVANPQIPEAMMFDAGADKWGRFESWPPRGATKGEFLPKPGQKVRLDLPGMPPGNWHELTGVFDEYVNDPRRPVPASASISAGMPRSYMIEDQRFAWNRPDVLSYESEALTQDVGLAGPLKATLYIQTTGTDADYVVKLIDVYPGEAPNNSPRGRDFAMGGYQMMVRGEPMRAKYRNSWSKPTPLTPNKIEKIEFSLPDVFYTFKTGHKIMIQIQSSWFPVIDRNPQKFLNIMEASESDFQKATHRIFLSGATASKLEVTVAR